MRASGATGGGILAPELPNQAVAHLFRVIVPVGNIDAAASFYAAVLGSKGQRVSPGRHYFECDGTILACYDPTADGDGYEATANPEPLYLAVSDLPAVYSACRAAGATFAKAVPPTSVHWVRSPHVRGARSRST